MKKSVLLSAAGLLILFYTSSVHATPDYAISTLQFCKTCHVNPDGGGELTEKGAEFAASGYVWPPKGRYRVLSPIKKSVRFIVGYLHILAGFIWFGTILYVHILLRPAYASKGLPRGEVFLGGLSMAVVGISGVLLTISRISSLDILLSTTWGRVLVVKIFLYLFMISSAMTVVRVVGPRLKRASSKLVLPDDGVFDPETLSICDGKEGRPAFIAFRNKVYDTGSSALWRGGMHMTRHSAGEDLTAAIAKAPHDEEKLEELKVVGAYDASRMPPRTPAQKAFYVIAYLNLSLVFAVLFVIAYWRWGI